MNLRNQKRMASELMKCGVNKVRFDPERIEEISEALTREDMRYLIKSGAILKLQDRGISRGRIRARLDKKKAGKRKGQGSRKGSVKTRTGGKRRWINKIRAIRDELNKMKSDEVVDESQYRKLYRQAKGNLFHSRRHVREHVERMVK